jgi:hypothetical protein
VAVYAPAIGDDNNLGATTACGDAHEGSIVEQFQPTQTTAQTWTVSDAITINVTGGGDLAGTAHFALYRSATCSGTAIAGTSEDVAVSGPSGTSVSTTPFTFTASESVLYWKVSYDSTNTKHADIAATCTENSVLTVNN